MKLKNNRSVCPALMYLLNVECIVCISSIPVENQHSPESINDKSEWSTQSLFSWLGCTKALFEALLLAPAHRQACSSTLSMGIEKNWFHCYQVVQIANEQTSRRGKNNPTFLIESPHSLFQINLLYYCRIQPPIASEWMDLCACACSLSTPYQSG